MKILNYCLLIFALLIVGKIEGQEHRISMSTGKLSIMEVDDVAIEGHSGNEIIIMATGEVEEEEDHEEEESEDRNRAAGLVAINAMGYKDNTGLGLGIEEKSGEVTVYQISTNSDMHYVFKVPKGVAIYYEHSSHGAEDLRIANVESEIEVTSNYNDIALENIMGAASVSSIYGSIDAKFSAVSQQHPITLHSVYDHVDVSVPASAKVNFRLSTTYGDMYTDLELEYNHATSKDGMRKLSSQRTVGKFNGGGVDFSIKATYDNIYLRKS